MVVAELWLSTPEGRTERVTLVNRVMVIGRDPACEFHLDDAGVSRRHAQIRPVAGGYVIEDLGSKNGTQVNGATLAVVRLRDGDVIVCGTRSMVFRQSAEAQTTTSLRLEDRGAAEPSTRYAGRTSDLVLPQQRPKVLYDLSDRLTRLRDSRDLLEDAMDVCFEMFRFERGAIGVREADRRTVDWPIIRNATGAEGELTISRTLVARAIEHGERSVVVEAEAGSIDPSVSMVRHGIRSALCVPLEYRGQILGVIYGDRISSGACYADEDMDFLAGLARQVSIGLVNSRLHEEQKLRLQLEGEIALARDIQEKLFPALLPRTGPVRMAAVNEPGRHVSGDYYDAIELGGGRWGILIADVTGKGVASSLLMANLQAAVRCTLDGARPLHELLGQWNTLIHRNTDARQFITCLVAIVDPSSRAVTLASAGHFFPYVVTPQRGASRELTVERGLPLGIQIPTEYASATVTLGPGPCTLFAYTDGVVEAMNADEELFGLPRTLDTLHACPDLDPERMIVRVRSAITSFCGPVPQGDDITRLPVHLP